MLHNTDLVMQCKEVGDVHSGCGSTGLSARQVNIGRHYANHVPVCEHGIRTGN